MAYCRASQAHVALYWLEIDHTSDRLALADAALGKAQAIQADSDEVHFARGWYFYQGLRDYDRARAELLLAQRTLPNNADIFSLAGSIDRRQGRWQQSTQELQRAVDLDPSNLFRLQTAGGQLSRLASLRGRGRDLQSSFGRRARGQEHSGIARANRVGCARGYTAVARNNRQVAAARLQSG